ncbi:helix-turn-helix domain-containing protein [Brevundimonas diminuta]|uniref:helix-turn-helix domain-containing protein n=1 Tax=Brevundimonas diminuta TaxID=293 RepID=UPI00320A7C95
MDSLSINAQIGANVKSARENANLSVDVLAAKIGSSTDQVARIEAGTHRASAEMLWQMAREMKVSASIFFTGFDQNTKS